MYYLDVFGSLGEAGVEEGELAAARPRSLSLPPLKVTAVVPRLRRGEGTLLKLVSWPADESVNMCSLLTHSIEATSCLQ